MTTTVYGADDDLIELEDGLDAEFSYSNDEGGDLLAFSNGVVLRIEYSKSGVWRITPVVDPLLNVTIVQAPEDDGYNYSDRCTIHDDLAWCVHGSEIVKGMTEAMQNDHLPQ